jgi:branched-chain amino acid transport system permease protein
MGVQIANIIIDGAINGCILGLIGVGFVILYRATGVISFAQGSFMVVGALLFQTTSSHVEFYLNFLLVGAVLFVLGGLTYRLVFAHLVGSPSLVTAIATVGLGTLLDAGAIVVWRNPSQITDPTPYSFHIYGFGDYKVNGYQFFTLAATAMIFAVILLGLRRTRVGLRMRAVANSERLASFAGVNVVTISTLAWALAAMAAAWAGVTYVFGQQTDPGTVYSLGIIAFPAILLGGFDSIGGSLIGGLIIGWLQGIIGTYIGGQWEDVGAYVVLLALLLVRPQGLFGSPEVARL